MSGCAGSRQAALPEDDEAGFGLTAPGNATVIGRVVSEELLPLPGLKVQIAALSAINNVTDAEGNFTLWNVPPGAHTIQVKSPGYQDGRIAVRAEPDAVIEGIDFVLKPIETKGQPFVETYVQAGMLSCGWSHPVASQPAQVTQACYADSNNKPAYEFPVNHQAGPFAIVLELQWEPVSPATGQELMQGLWLDATCDQDGCRSEHVVGNMIGPSPIFNQIGSLQKPVTNYYSKSAPQRSFSVVQLPFPERFPEGDPSKTYATLQQPFTHYVSVFYNSEPPAEYTLVP